MNCNIEYVGKKRNGTPQYYCLTHKSFASDKKGVKLKMCLCEFKEDYQNRFPLKNVQSLKVVYEDILSCKRPLIYINGNEFKGVLEYESGVLSYKDLGGLLLAKLNKVSLSIVKCNRCGHEHTDNGKFAYMPHSTHFCLYCGHRFRVHSRNIGNELGMMFDVPEIKLNMGKEAILETCKVEYDVFKGIVLVNDKEVLQVSYKGKEMRLVEFLNIIMENEY